MKKYLYISILIAVVFFGVNGVVFAATVADSNSVGIECRRCDSTDDEKSPDLELVGFRGSIQTSVHKSIDLVTEEGSNTPLSFNLDLNKKVTNITPATINIFLIIALAKASLPTFSACSSISMCSVWGTTRPSLATW